MNNAKEQAFAEALDEMNGHSLTSEKVHILHHSNKYRTACGRTAVGKVCTVAVKVVTDRDGSPYKNTCADCISAVNRHKGKYEAAKAETERARRKVTD